MICWRVWMPERSLSQLLSSTRAKTSSGKGTSFRCARSLCAASPIVWTQLGYAAALALLAWVERPHDRLPRTIGRDRVQAAIRLWSDYFRPHATAAINRAGPTDLERHARRILRWLKAGNRTEVSGEEVRCGGLGRTVNAGQTAEALDRLEAAGVVRRVRSATLRKGRPAERWEVNPAALVEMRGPK